MTSRATVLLARVLAKPDQGTVPRRIANLSGSAITLYKGTNLAKYCPLGSPELLNAEYAELPDSELSTQVHQVEFHQQSSASHLELIPASEVNVR